ncbi:hypothetical protein K432DRAFT_384878 [Lepidopterella palustris CBS 459.81]|uniref:Coenzyme Q-binding protein COQ10 START domain-containing protein n=1 Tax=Lepidopterella palustris CBS 459.81 TaxID=1314670 RepID=A0A8E2E4L2_9PEZI|nr:hypothetical protein K432DRAFT_384878 [Lepidopterella palustris CBS 459.81]
MKALHPPRPQTLSLLRPRLQPQPQSLLHPLTQQHLSPNRTFVPNPFASSPFPSTPQTLTAKRTLPYPSSAIYNIIADVSQYSSFLPYCQSSNVIRWSSPDSVSKIRWPSEARLVVGWGGITEEFHSNIYCVPGRVVEAVGGNCKTTLPTEDILHHTSADPEHGTPSGTNTTKAAAQSGLLTHLLTRWTVRTLPYTQPSSIPKDGKAMSPPQEHTEVNLAIEFAFANPIYSMLSAGAAPKVAEMMICAFEERMRTLLGVTGSGTARQGQGQMSEMGATYGVVGRGAP